MWGTRAGLWAQKGSICAVVMRALHKSGQISPASPHFQDIVPQADESPFGFDLLQPAEEKSAESSELLDLSENRLNTFFTLRVNSLSRFSP